MMLKRALGRIVDALEAEPSQELLKPVSAREVSRRSLVEIVNAETKEVLATICSRGHGVAIGNSPVTAATPAGFEYLNLGRHYDASRLARISELHGIIYFGADGNVVYEHASQHGTVIERRLTASFAGVPVLRFQNSLDSATGAPQLAAYLVRNAITGEAEMQNPAPFAAPNGILLKNGDELQLGFNYQVIRQTGLLASVKGTANTNALKAPADALSSGKLNVPRLSVYIR